MIEHRRSVCLSRLHDCGSFDRLSASIDRTIRTVTLCVLAGSSWSCASGTVIYRTRSAFKPPRSSSCFALLPLRPLSQHEAGLPCGAVSWFGGETLDRHIEPTSPLIHQNTNLQTPTPTKSVRRFRRSHRACRAQNHVLNHLTNKRHCASYTYNPITFDCASHAH